MPWKLVLCVFALAVAACTPTPASPQTAVAATESVQRDIATGVAQTLTAGAPSATPIPSSTPVPSATPPPTDTATPTRTPRPTATPPRRRPPPLTPPPPPAPTPLCQPRLSRPRLP